MEKVHLIGNAHLDPVWLWRWQEGYAEIKATFAAALDRIEEFDEFIFTSACAAYYEWVEENAPPLFSRIQKAVAEGRWNLAGGMWIQPDCNLPSGESFARHALYSQRYFAERFGKKAVTGYNVDSFGHAGSLPQILKESGLSYYVMMRPGEHEKALGFDSFLWRGTGAAEVPTFRIPYEYTVDFDRARVRDKADKCAALADATGLPVMCFYGVGNHGGGPTVAAIETLLSRRAEKNGERFLFSSPDEFFADLEAGGRLPALPVVEGDLQHHASGCYSTASALKAQNRRAEHRLYGAETASALSHLLLGAEYRAKELEGAWKRVLFNQFHDIAGGCSIREALEDAAESYSEALSVSARLLNAALQRFSWAVDTMPATPFSLSKNYDWALWERENGGAPLVVFNPHPFPIALPVECSSAARAVADAEGRLLPVQRVRAPRTNGGDKFNAIFPASLPPLGYSTFFIYKNTLPPEGETLAFRPVSAVEGVDDIVLENGLVSVSISKRSGLIRAYDDLESKKRLVSREIGRALVIDDEKSDTWAHNVFVFDKEIGSFSADSVRLVEDGPVRATVRVTSSFGSSVLTQDISLDCGSRALSVFLRADWREALKLLKLDFPVEAERCAATYEIPFSSIVREPNGNEQPGHAWADLTGQTDEEKRGLLLINDGRYSYSASGSSLRLTVLRSSFYADHYGERDEFCLPMDQGESTLRYTLLPHAGDVDRAAATREARLLCLPPQSVPETYHCGSLPLTGSSLSVEGAVLTALKLSEDGKALVLRLHEAEGREGVAELVADALSFRHTLPLKPFEIATLRVELSDRRVTRTDFTE